MPGEELTPEELEVLALVEAERVFDARVVAELERVPDLASVVPADFAARVAAMVPAKKLPAVRRFSATRATHYGVAAMWVGLFVLLAMVVMTSRGLASSAFAMTVEALLFAEFAAAAVWLGLRRWREG